MPSYKYEAMDHAGAEVTGTIDAESEGEAQQLIRDQDLFVTKITEEGRKKKKKEKKGDKKGGARRRKAGGGFSIGRVGGKQLCQFTRQLSTLQDAGLPILRSLMILEGQSKSGPLKTSLVGVIEDIQSGSTLSEAMAKQPKAFDDLYVNMVKAGEAGGALEVILQRLAEFKERAQSLKRKVVGAMIYPAAVISVAILIVSGIMVFIIPKFKKIFEGFDVELPDITIVLLNASDWFATYWWVLVVSPIAFVLTIKLIKKNKTGAFVIDWIALKLPLLGKILQKSTVARTMRTLGTLIASGVPILEALTIARDTAGNNVFKRAFDNIHSSIREGEAIAVPLREARIVDDIVVNMVDVGEETGALDTMMYKVAEVYDEEVAVAVDGLISMLEPIMVVVLGFIVGFIVIALFMPLVKLLNELS